MRVCEVGATGRVSLVYSLDFVYSTLVGLKPAAEPPLRPLTWTLCAHRPQYRTGSPLMAPSISHSKCGRLQVWWVSASDTLRQAE